MRNLCRPRASSISRISRRGSTDQPVADQTDQQDSKWIAKINFQNGLWRMYFIYKHMHIAAVNFSLFARLPDQRISRISRRGSDGSAGFQMDCQNQFSKRIVKMYFIYKHMHIAVDNFSHKAFFGDCQKTTTQNQKKRRNICENRKVRE